MKNLFSSLFLLFFSFSVFAQSSLIQYGTANQNGKSGVFPPMTPVTFLTQNPNGVNGLFADKTCALCPTGQQTVADNFNVTVANSTTGITGLVIWGGYYPEDIPNTTDMFTLIFHANNAGQPGANIATLTNIQAASRVQTGVVLFGTHEYMFTFNFATPIMLPPGTAMFWLELFNDSNPSGNYYWETGNVDGTHGVAGSGWYTTCPATAWNLDPSTDMSWILSGDDNIVPVELVSFQGSANGSDVNLSWITATETNNRGFAIQRKSDGDYQTIGFVQGNGTTTENHAYSYTDRNVNVGTYSYRLMQFDFDGKVNYSNVVNIDVKAPATFSLQQNYPNPFNPSTTISFKLAVDSKVSLKVFNVLGQEVANLVNSNLVAGSHEVNFNASSVNSGVYMYRLEVNGVDGHNFVDVKKMILSK